MAASNVTIPFCTATFFAPRAEAVTSFLYYIGETMTNHKKMVHPPSFCL
ncbi:MAG: hypothetical protein JNL72_07870 [Flavipsychrobacter sp.]|nr:hypothetical protein [Flavipsychrobacter sp.]